jgi:hypothetical protein
MPYITFLQLPEENQTVTSQAIQVPIAESLSLFLDIFTKLQL